MVKKTIAVNTSTGLHARPASQLVNFVKAYGGTVKIHFNGKTGDLKSILNVLSMGIVSGSEVEIEVIGDDEEKFAEDIVDFITNKLTD